MAIAAAERVPLKGLPFSGLSQALGRLAGSPPAGTFYTASASPVIGAAELSSAVHRNPPIDERRA